MYRRVRGGRRWSGRAVGGGGHCGRAQPEARSQQPEASKTRRRRDVWLRAVVCGGAVVRSVWHLDGARRGRASGVVLVGFWRRGCLCQPARWSLLPTSALDPCRPSNLREQASAPRLRPQRPQRPQDTPGQASSRGKYPRRSDSPASARRVRVRSALARPAHFLPARAVAAGQPAVGTHPRTPTHTHTLLGSRYPLAAGPAGPAGPALCPPLRRGPHPRPLGALWSLERLHCCAAKRPSASLADAHALLMNAMTVPCRRADGLAVQTPSAARTCCCPPSPGLRGLRACEPASARQAVAMAFG